MYSWLDEKLIDNHKGQGSIILSDDFTDIGMGSIGIEAIEKRLSLKKGALLINNC